MLTNVWHEPLELSQDQLEAVNGGGYIHLHPTGFGARTDYMLVQKQIMESNYRGAIVAPILS